MKIVPTVLTNNFSELKEILRRIEDFCNYAQIDIMDGRFTNSKSIKLSDIFRVKTSLDMELHLMVKNPLKYVKDFKKNIKKIFFHYEAEDSPVKTIEKIRAKRLKVGVAINPETKIKKIKDLLYLIDSVLILSVNPGFYGNKFIPQTLKKIEQIRRIRTDIEIGLDGGIKLENISKILNYPLDYLCIGSAIIKSKNPKSAFLEFKKILQKNLFCHCEGE